MKIILLNDVPNIGQKYDVKEVKNGFAQNFLIPQKLAEVATPAALTRLEKMKKKAELERKREEEKLILALDKIKGATLTLKEKATEAGGLFASISKEKIAHEIKKKFGIEIPQDCIMAEKPLKEVGEYDISLKTKEKSVKFKLIVEKEE